MAKSRQSALNVIVVSIASLILYRTLRDVDLQKVWTTMADISAWTIALAGLFLAGGYLTMMLYATSHCERSSGPTWRKARHPTASAAGTAASIIVESCGPSTQVFADV